jgi:hypothetical protein
MFENTQYAAISFSDDLTLIGSLQNKYRCMPRKGAKRMLDIRWVPECLSTKSNENDSEERDLERMV